MTIREVCGVMSDADRLKIIKGGRSIYNGFWGTLKDDENVPRWERIGLTGAEEVTRLGHDEEIRHRKWRELGLTPPCEPDKTPDYSFNDMQVMIYQIIHIAP